MSPATAVLQSLLSVACRRLVAFANCRRLSAHRSKGHAVRKGLKSLFGAVGALLAFSVACSWFSAVASASDHAVRHKRVSHARFRDRAITVRRAHVPRCDTDARFGACRDDGFPEPVVTPFAIYNYYRHGGPGCTPANAGYDGYYGCGPGYVSLVPLFIGDLLTGY